MKRMKYHKKYIAGIMAGLLFASLLLSSCALTKKPAVQEFTTLDEMVTDLEDPLSEVEESGSEYTDFTTFLSQVKAYEQEGVSVGIDVSKWQGTIDWPAVAEAGVEFAIIRVGYRTVETGVIFEDPYAKYNLQQAQAAGIKLGAYFFSSALTEEEAREEAAWTCAYISQYKITYPVVYNCEGFKVSGNRNYNLSNDQRSSNAIAFLELVETQGYTPMFYASKNELQNSNYWNTQAIAAKFAIWVSQYPGTDFSRNSKTSYTGEYDCWQFTHLGIVPGITRNVDVNIAYFTYEQEAAAKNLTPYELVEPPESTVSYSAVNETVTAKIETNLRTEPSTDSEDTIVVLLKNGETVTRKAVGSNGWSQIEYNGQLLYAKTAYLEVVNQQEAQ